MILGRSNNVQRKTTHIMLQNTPTPAQIRQQIKFNDRLFLKNQSDAAGIKDFFRKIGRGAKRVWDKVKKPVQKVWDFVTEGPGNTMLNLIPKVGPAISKTLKTVDDVIDTGKEIVSDAKTATKQIKQNLSNNDAKLLDNVDTDKLKQDYDWVRDKTREVYNKVKDKLTPTERASAIEAGKIMNLSILDKLHPMQRGKMRRILPFAPYIKVDKQTRVTVPKKIRDLISDAPKTIDNTGGRLFLKGYASGINLDEVDSGNTMNGRISLSGGAPCGNVTLAEPESGRIGLSGSTTKSTSTKNMSKEEIYKKLFGSN